MKDFIGSVPKKKYAHSRTVVATSLRLPSRLFKWLIAVTIVGLLALLAWLLLRTLQWSDFIQTDNQETVLFLAEKVDQSGAFVVQFLFDELQIDAYPIPSDLPLELGGGYGTYRFQAVYPLLTLEGKELPYIRSAFSLSTGVLLDELWHADTANLDFSSRSRFQAFLIRHFFSNSQVAISQKLAWLALVFDQRTDYVVHEPLTSLPSPIFEQLNFAAQQACTVAIINTTPLAGLAGRMASLLESHHFRVVRTTSDDTTVAKTTVLFAEDLSTDCAIVLDKLEKLVPGGLVRQIDAAETVRNRADLVVRLGSDLAE